MTLTLLSPTAGLAMPSDRGDVTLSRIRTAESGDYYVHITWTENGRMGFRIQATDGLRCWRGAITPAEMRELSTKASLSCDDFAELTYKALSQPDVQGNAPLRCFVMKTDKSLQLAWKQVLPNEQIKFQLGCVKLEECSGQGLVQLQFLGDALTLTQQLHSSCLALTLENRRLACERESALKKVEQMVQAKEEHEKILFDNFIAVLNAKKEKLRQLTADRAAALTSKISSGRELDHQPSASCLTKPPDVTRTHVRAADSSDDTEAEEENDKRAEALVKTCISDSADLSKKTDVLSESLLSNDDDVHMSDDQPMPVYRRRALGSGLGRQPLHDSQESQAGHNAVGTTRGCSPVAVSAAEAIVTGNLPVTANDDLLDDF